MSRSRSYQKSRYNNLNRRPLQSLVEALATFEGSDMENELELDPAYPRPNLRLVFYLTARDERELYAGKRFGGLAGWELERFLAYATNEPRFAFQKAA